MQQVQFSAFQSPADKLQFRQSIFVLFMKAGALPLLKEIFVVAKFLGRCASPRVSVLFDVSG